MIDVPQSISVLGGDDLERTQAPNFQDYVKFVPGLQLTQSQPGFGRLVLRGINTGGVASTVGVYVDETPFGSSSGLANGAILAGDFDTFDVARVEVLRGPQGTLYGASSLGGVLKYVTNEPQTDAFEGRVRGSFESVDGGDMSYSGAGSGQHSGVRQRRDSRLRLLSQRGRLHRFDRHRRDSDVRGRHQRFDRVGRPRVDALQAERSLLAAA